ncbi:MAG: magnesium and cobalt transport protein CorA [Treponema sp. CETP13]|nr:MAG: magnesium and cobalt transport protein CorA [Treponema sp. CETP13]
MARFLIKKEKTIGQVPGEPVFIGEQKVSSTSIQMIDYDKHTLTDMKIEDIREAIKHKDTSTVTWININGLHDTELIKKIGEGFNLHALVLEDIVNTGQRPRLEDYDNCLYLVLRMMFYENKTGKVQSEQLTILVGETFLLTFQEKPGDVFNPVRDRIKNQKGRIRKVGSDYLAYAILDTIIDNYLVIIERIGDKIEDIEDLILENPDETILTKINSYKREINYLSKTIRPAKEFILQLCKLESEIIKEPTRTFFRDLLDLSSQAVDAIDTYRDMLSDYLSMYNSQVNNKLNEIMKVLTIFSAIFIPITFIAGVYGTNFDFIPELHFKYGYFVMWGAMIVLVLFMIRFFHHKKWF